MGEGKLLVLAPNSIVYIATTLNAHVQDTMYYNTLL